MFIGTDIISGKSSGLVEQARPSAKERTDQWQSLLSSLVESEQDKHAQGLQDISDSAVYVGALLGIQGELLKSTNQVQQTAEKVSGEFTENEGVVAGSTYDLRINCFFPASEGFPLPGTSENRSASGEEAEMPLTDGDIQSRLKSAASIRTAIMEALKSDEKGAMKMIRGENDSGVPVDLSGHRETSVKGKTEERSGSDILQEQHLRAEDADRSTPGRPGFTVAVDREIAATEKTEKDDSHQESEPIKAGSVQDNVLGRERTSVLTADSHKTENVKQAQEATTRVGNFDIQEEIQPVTLTQKSHNSIKLSVEPDGLGKLDILLSVDKGGMVNAQINADENAGKVFIDKYLNSIVHALASDGLNVGEFSVSLRGRRREATDSELTAYGEDIASEGREQGLSSRSEDNIISIFV